MTKFTLALTVTCIVFMTGIVAAQQTEHAATGLNMTEMKFGPIPGLPTCATAAVQSGDPTKEASILLAKASAGCTFPWHWHTPNEHIMMVSGQATLETKDGKSLVLDAGGYAMMPSHHVHSFSCTSDCALYVHSDGAFDMHYVDSAGKEITPEEALKAVGETAATAPK
jgi:quercetin dioxygenase-like cupin family protein